MNPKIIILKKGKEAPIERFHPWVFSGAIHKIKGEPTDGDVVEIHASNGDFLAMAHFQEGGSIAARIFSFAKCSVDAAFWQRKIQAAYDFRRAIGISEAPTTNAFRLVHGEGDGLPSLIIDLYGSTAVLQCHSIGMHRERYHLAEALKNVLGNRLTTIFDKSKETLPPRYAATVENEYLQGSQSNAVILENGHQFFVDWETGQKTGFFLDQRDNRQFLGGLVAEKTVLNAFAYSGGFSVYALQGGAAAVHSIDASAKAIEWTDRNVALNGGSDRHQSIVGDVLKYLKTEDLPNFDVMILDPPAFAKTLSKRHNAVQGYKRLNALALSRIRSGGVLLTFSCSQVVSRELFYNTITAAAMEARRRVRVLRFLSQPADHPVSLFHPEGEYLKGLVLFVDE